MLFLFFLMAPIKLRKGKKNSLDVSKEKQLRSEEKGMKKKKKKKPSKSGGKNRKSNMFGSREEKIPRKTFSRMHENRNQMKIVQN